MINRFFLYSLPFSDQYVYIQNKKGEALAVEMVSFDKSEKLQFHSDEILLLDENQLKNITLNPFEESPVIREHYLNQAEYESRIQSLKESMSHDEVEKVVFSRIKKLEGELDLMASFIRLRKSQPDAFCYVMHYDEVETWMGATPELLLSKDGEVYKTISLAGTIGCNDEWTEKELEEQNMVTQYISQLLIDKNLNFKISNIEDAKQGNFKHLKQTIEIDNPSLTFNQLVQILHPTPAVCGLPKDKALKLIHQYELHDRDFYTGYISLPTLKEPKAFVNIRCAKIFRNYANLYIGGGITQDSDPKSEWQETEMKASIIENAMVSNQ